MRLLVAFRRLTAYYTLLFAAGPSGVDIFILCTGIVAAIVSGVPFPLVGIVFGQLLDDFNESSCQIQSRTTASDTDSQNDVNQKILLILYLAIAQFVAIYVHLTCFTLSGSRLAQRLREKYLSSLLDQEPAFFDSFPPGEVASRLDGDIQIIRSGTAEKAGIVLSAFSFFVTAYMVAFIKDWPLAAMLLSLVPAYFLMSFVGSHFIEKYAASTSEYAASAAGLASEALANLEVVLAFGANKRLESQFADQLVKSEREGIRKANAVGIQTGCMYFIAYAANGLAFWQGSRQVAEALADGTTGTTVGVVFTVIFVMAEATLLLSQVAPFFHLFSAAVGSFEKLRVDMNRQSTLVPSHGAAPTLIPSTTGDIRFENVSFSYPTRPDIPVLDGLNLHLETGRHTAIVGHSGSGKSTIASLLGRLYDPKEGRILLGDLDIRNLDLSELRSRIGVVEQEPTLFDCSLLENVTLSLLHSRDAAHARFKSLLLNKDLSEMMSKARNGEDVKAVVTVSGQDYLDLLSLAESAAKAAHATDFIRSLPHGWATNVGTSGKHLSGGQKQRIALARALIKQPSILILDEATSAVDSATESEIQRGLLDLPPSTTVISIAHRLSTVRTANKIVVMHQGQLVEEGTHAELLGLGGRYASLVGMQAAPSNDDPNASDHQIVLTKSDRQSKEVDEKSSYDFGKATDEETSTVEDEERGPSRSLWQLVRGYAPAVRPYTLLIIVALTGSMIVGASFCAEAVIFGNTVGSLSPCNDPGFIRSQGELFGILFFILAIIELFANIASVAGFGRVSEKLIFTVRVLSFRSLFEHSMQWHQSGNRTAASSLSFITRDATALAGFSGSVVGSLFSITVNLVAAIILTHIIAWRIALVCLALVPLLLGAGLMELRVLGKFEEQHESAFVNSVAIGVEAVSAIKTVAAFGLEERTMHAYRDALAAPMKATLKVTVQASFWQAMTYFLGNTVNALAYWWGSKQIIAGNYTQTQFLIVVFSLLVGALLWSQMFALAPELTKARSAAARILGLIESGSTPLNRRYVSSGKDVAGDPEKAEYPSMSGSSNRSPASVSLRNVEFSYPARPEVQVLNGLTLNIKAGQFCAFVGPSGAGKSTVISLIERLYTPSAGSITFDGAPLSSEALSSVAMVPQEAALFAGTVQFNIALGSRPGREATMEEIVDACKLANIHETIEALPEGYQTLCGPGGNHFSGGQRQRLSIARALVRKPRLLILDEPTSALDAESEKLLQQGLDKAKQGVTVIAIAHRLHTIKQADVIFLIDRGTCVDSGSHEELMTRSESYRSNVLHQTLDR